MLVFRRILRTYQTDNALKETNNEIKTFSLVSDVGIKELNIFLNKDLNSLNNFIRS